MDPADDPGFPPAALDSIRLARPREEGEPNAYERYLVSCSDYLKRQMMIYEHWPQRRYDVLGYRKEKVFTDMNA